MDTYIFLAKNFFKFKTDDKIKDYISLMGNNMCRYAIIIEEKYIFHSSSF